MKKEKPSRLAQERTLLAIRIIRLSWWCSEKAIQLLELLGVAFNYTCAYDVTVERSISGQTWKMGVYSDPRNTRAGTTNQGARHRKFPSPAFLLSLA